MFRFRIIIDGSVPDWLHLSIPLGLCLIILYGVFMNFSLMKSGSATPVKNRAWHYFRMACISLTSKHAFARLAALSPILLLGVGQVAHTADLLAGGKDDVKETFGADSFVMMCIIIAEIVVGVAMYIKTKNLLVLLGLVVVIVFTTVGLTFVK